MLRISKNGTELDSDGKIHVLLLLCFFFFGQGMDSCETAGAENTLLLVADVLATLAVTETGQRQLLYGETQDRWQRSRYCSRSRRSVARTMI